MIQVTDEAVSIPSLHEASSTPGQRVGTEQGVGSRAETRVRHLLWPPGPRRHGGSSLEPLEERGPAYAEILNLASRTVRECTLVALSPSVCGHV